MTKLKPIAYMLVGVPGSGKSFWAEPYLARDFKLVSSDTYIEKIAAETGQTYSDAFVRYAAAAMSWMKNVVDIYVSACVNIVWDQTNLTRATRREKIDRLIAAGYDVIAVTFEIPDGELARRRQEREKVVGKVIPQSILEQMGKTYERPTRLEGFSKVIIVTPHNEYESTE